MATNKPKVQGYVERSLFDCFESERQTWGLTQSQALEQILVERYRKNQQLGNTQENPITQRLNLLEAEFKDMRAFSLNRFGQVSRSLAQIQESIANSNLLQITSDTESELPEITSNIDSDSLQITSDIDSDLPEITSDIDSDSLQITSDIDSDSLQITSDIDSELPEITSDIGSELPEITSDIGSELPEITSDIESESISASHPYFDRFLVCELRKDGLVDYWAEDGGLSPDIRQAKVYEHKRYAEAQLRKLQSGLSPAVADNIKLATARTRLEAEIGLNKIPYSLRQIFDYWEKQELRRIRKRKSKGQKGKSEITE